MKNLLKHLLSCLCLTMFSISVYAESEQISIRMSSFQYDNQKEETRPAKGNRIPVAPIFCTIDFDNHRIELSISGFITTYELWDEDGTSLIASYASDSEFVDFLSGLSGAYQIRLVGEDHAYIGYLEL